MVLLPFITKPFEKWLWKPRQRIRICALRAADWSCLILGRHAITVMSKWVMISEKKVHYKQLMSFCSDWPPYWTSLGNTATHQTSLAVLNIETETILLSSETFFFLYASHQLFTTFSPENKCLKCVNTFYLNLTCLHEVKKYYCHYY